jgi:hypothetical protein
VNYAADDVKNNPLDLTTDPDFLALNPDFKPLAFLSRIPDMLVPLGQSDVARHLWAWVAADPDARDFLAGKKDPWGMTVNPNYTTDKLNLPRDDFPKSDPFCQTFPNDPNKQPPLCTLDAHPYAVGMHDAARSTARGDRLSKTIWDATATPPQLKKATPEPQGQIGILAVTDTATAARYGLDTANLLNGAGQFVAPTPDSMLAAEAAMAPVGTTGVSLLAPDSKAKDAYPLTVISYAATVPSLLSKSEGGAYASLLRFAAGPGQTPGVQQGQLVDGYVPLPQSLRTQASTAAQAIQDGSGQHGGSTAGTTTAGGTSAGATTAGGTSAGTTAGGGAGDTAIGGLGTGGSSTGGSLTGGSSTGGSGAGGSGASGGAFGGQSGAAHGTPTLAPSSPAVQNIARTAATPVGAAQYLFLVLLCVAMATAMVGPLLSRFLRRNRS